MGIIQMGSYSIEFQRETRIYRKTSVNLSKKHTHNYIVLTGGAKCSTTVLQKAPVGT